MDIFDLVQSHYFWAAFGLSGLILVALWVAAAREASSTYLRYSTVRRKIVPPPGIWGISVAGTRIFLWGGTPCERFLHPETLCDFVVNEPTLVVWYAAGWLMILQMWEPACYCLCGVFLWRIFWDVLLEPVPVGSPDIRLQRCMVHSLWAAALGIFNACLSACVVAAVLAILCALAFAAGGGGSDRRRRR